MLCFVSHEAETLTPELEKQITDSNAWAHVVPAGNIKPATNAGAFVLQSYTELNTKVNILETELKKEKQKREESDLILANQISQINNLLKEKDIITRDNERIDHAHTLLYYCQVCFERQRNMRLVPCGHMATCEECTEQIISINGLCPLCITAVIRTEHTFVS
jgi:hypothetical protein